MSTCQSSSLPTALPTMADDPMMNSSRTLDAAPSDPRKEGRSAAEASADVQPFEDEGRNPSPTPPPTAASLDHLVLGDDHDAVRAVTSNEEDAVDLQQQESEFNINEARYSEYSDDSSEDGEIVFQVRKRTTITKKSTLIATTTTTTAPSVPTISSSSAPAPAEMGTCTSTPNPTTPPAPSLQSLAVSTPTNTRSGITNKTTLSPTTSTNSAGSLGGTGNGNSSGTKKTRAARLAAVTKGRQRFSGTKSLKKILGRISPTGGGGSNNINSPSVSGTTSSTKGSPSSAGSTKSSPSSSPAAAASMATAAESPEAESANEISRSPPATTSPPRAFFPEDDATGGTLLDAATLTTEGRVKEGCMALPLATHPPTEAAVVVNNRTNTFAAATPDTSSGTTNDNISNNNDEASSSPPAVVVESVSSYFSSLMNDAKNSGTSAGKSKKKKRKSRSPPKAVSASSSPSNGPSQGDEATSSTKSPTASSPTLLVDLAASIALAEAAPSVSSPAASDTTENATCSAKPMQGDAIPATAPPTGLPYSNGTNTSSKDLAIGTEPNKTKEDTVTEASVVDGAFSGAFTTPRDVEPAQDEFVTPQGIPTRSNPPMNEPESPKEEEDMPAAEEHQRESADEITLFPVVDDASENITTEVDAPVGKPASVPTQALANDVGLPRGAIAPTSEDLLLSTNSSPETPLVTPPLGPDLSSVEESPEETPLLTPLEEERTVEPPPPIIPSLDYKVGAPASGEKKQSPEKAGKEEVVVGDSTSIRQSTLEDASLVSADMLTGDKSIGKKDNGEAGATATRQTDLLSGISTNYSPSQHMPKYSEAELQAKIDAAILKAEREWTQKVKFASSDGATSSELAIQQEKFDTLKKDHIAEMNRILHEHEKMMQQQRQTFEQKIHELEGSTEELQETIATLQRKLEEDKVKHQSDLKFQGAAHDVQYRELSDMLDQLMAEQEEKENELKEKLRAKEMMFDTVGKSLKEAEDKKVELEEAFEKNQTQVGQLRVQMEEDRNSVEALKQTIEEMQANHKLKMQKEAENRKIACEEARNEMIKEAEMQFAKANDEYKKLKAKYASSMKSVKQLEAELKEAKIQSDSIAQDQQLRQKEITAEVARLRADLAAAESDIATDAKKYTLEIADMKERERKLLADLEALKKDREAAHASLSTVVTEKERLKKENEEINEVCEQLLAMAENGTNQ